AAYLEAFALADGVVDDAPMRAEPLAGGGMDDRPGFAAFGAQRLDDPGIVAVGHEADVLAVGLGRVAQAGGFGKAAHVALRQAAERKAQEVELVLGRRIEKIRLVARR